MVDKPRRFTWDDFPRVLIHAQESSVKQHPSYILAKSGDPDAAFQLVGDFISKEVVRRLEQLFHHLNPILASAHAIEGMGVNAIPETLANMLSEYLGWRTDSGIVQTNIVGHTGADGFSRLARQALFDGNVIPNEHMEKKLKDGGAKGSDLDLTALRSLKRVICSEPRMLTESEIKLLRQAKAEIAGRFAEISKANSAALLS